MCQEACRNSPSVTTRSPICCWLATALLIASSSIRRNWADETRPARTASRAWSSSAGRNRLPTWSAGKGGLGSIRVREKLRGGFIVQRVAVPWTPQHVSQSTLVLLGTQLRQERLPLIQLQSRVAIAGEVACRLDGQFAAERRSISTGLVPTAETRWGTKTCWAGRVVSPASEIRNRRWLSSFSRMS